VIVDERERGDPPRLERVINAGDLSEDEQSFIFECSG
jgi:hypothetical protein